MANFIKNSVSIITIMLTLFSCSVSNINLKEDKIKKIYSIAIIPFEHKKEIPTSIVNGCEEKFSNSFMSAGYKIVERNKISEILKEQELSLAFSSFSNDTASLLGADAILAGQITEYSEIIQNYEYFGYDKDEFGFEIKEINDEKTKQKVKLEKKKIFDKKHTLEFKIYLRLISVKTSETILFMENIISSKSYNESDSNIYIMTLNQFVNSIIEDMNNELSKSLLVINKK